MRERKKRKKKREGKILYIPSTWVIYIGLYKLSWVVQV
jgi:hypothetical protein